MIAVKFPEPAFRLKKEKDVEWIFDMIRKQWLVLTEEEWVRQNFIQFLIQILHYPAAFIAVEKEIMLGELKKRFDILVYNKDHKPWMMIECKAPVIPLSDTALQQVLLYNITVPVFFLIITNGEFTYGWEKANGTLNHMDHLPAWQ